MIIEASKVNMGSTRSYRKTEKAYTKYERTTTIEGSTNDSDFLSAYLGTDKNASNPETSSEQSSANEQPSSLLDLYKANVNTHKTEGLHENQMKTIERVRNEVFQYLMRLLFGDTWEYNTESDSSDSTYTYGTSTTSYTSFYEYSESETMSFSSTGCVQTSDGRQIDFGINLTLSRSFMEATSSQIDYSVPIVIDPLVINFDTPSASISDQNFFFDLDSDGTAEELKSLSSGSGFLALDENENGIIDDGSELFGTKTGNGFADLALHDKDQNGWIDEADEVFSKLKVWYKDEAGNDKLLSLKEAGVGAIYLGSAEGDYSITDNQNKTNAIIRRTGVFLYEDGNVGTVQQLDLAT